MDNGTLQKDQAARVRLVVSQSKRKKGRPQPLLTSQTPRAIGDGMCLPSSENASSPPAPSIDLVDQQLDNFTHNEPHYQNDGFDSSCFSDTAWSLWPSSDISEMEPSFDVKKYNPTPSTSQDQYSVQQLGSPGSSEINPVSAADLPFLQESSEISSAIAAQKGFRSMNDGSTYSTLNGLQSSASHHDEFYPEEAASYDLVSTSSPISTLSGGIEDTLFMYYLDHVFYVQFPFYHPQNGRRRGWFFSILRSVKSAYHAALALSERQLLSMSAETGKSTNSFVRLRTQNGHYDIAAREMQIMLNSSYKSEGRARFIHSLEVLTSLLQLLYCEVRMTSLGQSSRLII